MTTPVIHDHTVPLADTAVTERDANNYKESLAPKPPVSDDSDGAHRTTTGKEVLSPPKLSDDTNEKDAVMRVSEAEQEVEVFDLYQPLPVLKGVQEEPYPFTIRAVITGIVFGSLINAANVYLGLKTGFTFPAGMFGSIFGFAILKSISKAVPENTPILGGFFGPQENSIIQAAAVGAGGLSGMFVAALPAMYNMGLLKTPQEDFGRILTLTLVGSFFGLFFAVPLRKFFVINVARELKLMFPTPTATALTIRSMHAVGSGAAEALAKVKALGYAFTGAITLRVVSDYALGILWDWHIFTWFFIWGNYNNYAIVIENWGWWIEWTPAFIGSGLLVGLNVGISYFLGSFAAWGIIGPLLIYTGECVGVPLTSPEDGELHEKWNRAVSYFSMSNINDPDVLPSPRYWLLWPGVMVLLCYSMAEFIFHWKILWFGVKYAWVDTAGTINASLTKRGKASPWLEKQSHKAVNDSGALVEDFATPDQQVPVWAWSLGALVVIIVSVIIFEAQFHINGGLAVLASILALIFAFMSIHGGAVTDVTPLTASSKASQLVFGGVTKGHDPHSAQTANLLAGTIASSGADMSTALTSDFRTGFLLRTPPKLQFYAQCCGVTVAMFLAPGIFILFSKAYPCILDLSNEKYKGHCEFPAPSVTAWKAVAEAVTAPQFRIPLSSGIFSIVLGVVCVFQVAVKRYYLVGAREKYRDWLPNWMSIGVAFVLPATQYSTAMLMGAVISHVWNKKSPVSWDRYCFAVAGGLVAGEGLGGVIQAILTLAGVGGKIKGSQIACPVDSC
ncbi:oligopeptide transporter [Apiospora phragmitis]|uniref:Oligopeptide transporter n=1 Tax=Apiospora phragmitis TaxID=2905665 RepID=A0ABR1VGD7_9PEZI